MDMHCFVRREGTANATMRETKGQSVRHEARAVSETRGETTAAGVAIDDVTAIARGVVLVLGLARHAARLARGNRAPPCTSPRASYPGEVAPQRGAAPLVALTASVEVR